MDDISDKKVNMFSDHENFEKFTKDAFAKLIEGTRASNNLPKALDWDYYSTFPSFEHIMEKQSSQILDMGNVLLQHLNISANIYKHTLEEKMDVLVDCNEFLLERVKNNLDKLAGFNKDPEPEIVNKLKRSQSVSGSWNKPVTVTVTSQRVQGKATVRLLAAKNVIRPQTMFSDKIDNSNDKPWQPRIKNKSNSIKPLAIFLEETNDDRGQGFSHPYEFELFRFKPSESQLKYAIPQFPKPLNEVPLKWVDTVSAVQELYEDLLKYSEIAIDLEHHSYRSFQGITCLMQISTGDTDYLIDTLSLRNDLEILNEIFTKQTIVKIFHGADFDIEWLQRDLSLYIVNMFDTHQAAKQLNYPQLSLAALMRQFCEVDPDKTYQLADWRIRPLPEPLQLYAREDTHYLIYIYHMLRNELLQQANGNTNYLEVVINRSTDICKKRYVKPMFKSDGYLELYRASRRTFDNRQLYALSEIYRWRDTIARSEDESLGFVLPTHMMLHIADTLPREVQGILACCNPVPPLVRHHLVNLHQIILKARQQPVIQPILKEEPVQRNIQQWHHTNLNGPLHCPHDLSKDPEFRNDLPTLINTKNNNFNNITSDSLENDEPKINIFISDKSIEETSKIKQKSKKIRCLYPYERYKLVKDYIQEEAKQQEQSETDKKDNASLDVVVDNTLRISKLYENVNKYVKGLEDAFNKSNNEQKKTSIEKQTNLSNTENKQSVQNTKKRKHDMLDTDQSSSIQKNTTKEKKTPIPLRAMNKRKHIESNHKIKDRSEAASEDKILFNVTQDVKRRKIDGNWSDNKSPQKDVKNSNNKKANRKQHESETNKNFKPFEYSSVDFSKFQGGSNSGTKTNETKSKFNRMNKKSKIFKKSNNKSFSFGKTLGDKRGCKK